MSSSPVGDLFVYLLFLPCGVNVSKIQMLTRSAWALSVGIPAIWCSFLFPRKDYFCVSFMMSSLCADKIRNFLIEFLYDFCLLFRWLFATCIDLLCSSSDVTLSPHGPLVFIKCWEFVAFPCQGDGCWFYPLLFPQRTFLVLSHHSRYHKDNFSVLLKLQKRNWQLHLQVWY